MPEELRRRNYAESTIHTYIQTVEHFSRHFHRRRRGNIRHSNDKRSWVSDSGLR